MLKRSRRSLSRNSNGDGGVDLPPFTSLLSSNLHHRVGGRGRDMVRVRVRVRVGIRPICSLALTALPLKGDYLVECRR